MFDPAATGGEQPQAAGRCPICRKPADPVLRPFCSKRCADIDLHRWLSDSYRVPTEEEPDGFDDADLPDRSR